jgi:hypothetical protein
MLHTLAAFTVGDGIAVCGGLASTVAVIFMMTRNRKVTTPYPSAATAEAAKALALTAVQICEAAKLCAATVAMAERRLGALDDLAKSADAVLERVCGDCKKCEDVIRLSADMAHLKELHEGLGNRFERLFNIVQSMLQSTGSNNG